MDQYADGHHSNGWRSNRSGTGGGAVYGIGMLGALVYFFQNAHTFSAFVIGFFKALFWPGFLVYEALKYLHM